MKPISIKKIKAILARLILLKLLLLINTPICYGDSENLGIQKSYEKSQKIILATIEKSKSGYKTKSLRVVIGEFSYLSDYQRWRGKFYNGRVVSFRSQDLGYFMVDFFGPLHCEDSQDEEGSSKGNCVSLEEGEFVVQIPYFPNGKEAHIYDKAGRLVYTIDLSSKATCNEDKKCNHPVEDLINCPQDCNEFTPLITEKTIESGGPEMAVSNEEGYSLSFWLAVAVLFLFIFGGVSYYIYRRHELHKDETYYY